MAKNHKNSAEAGVTLLEGMIVCALGLMVATAIFLLQAAQMKQMTNARIAPSINQLKETILRALSNSPAWFNTIASSSLTQNNNLGVGPNPTGPGLDCLALASTPCSVDPVTGLFADITAGGVALGMNADGTNPGRPIRFLKDGNDNVVFDFTTPGSGFTLDGKPCVGFNAAVGNDACPLSFSATWTAVCLPTTCVDPQVKVSIKAAYNPASSDKRMLVSASGLSFEYFPRKSPSGSFNPAKGSFDSRCALPKSVFRYTGSQQTYTVPANVTQILIKVWGSFSGQLDDGAAAGGGFSYGELAVTAGSKYAVLVGGVAAHGCPGGTCQTIECGGGWPFGRGGGYNACYEYFSGGGGLSGFFENSPAGASTNPPGITASSQARALVVAGGGGGGVQAPYTGWAGWAGTSGNSPGSGGKPNMQGAGGITKGGGGGYSGGLAGRGGSGFVHPSLLNPQMLAGSTNVMAKNGDADFVSYSAGSRNGLVVIKPVVVGCP